MSISRGGMSSKSCGTFCLVLFALLLVAAPCFAYADDLYTVTIPAEVSVYGSSQQAGLAINGTLGARQELDISVTSANNFKLTCGSYSLSYALSGDDYSNGRMRFTSPSGACTFDSALQVSLAGGQTPPVSGVYEDKLTFSYSCSAARLLSLNANGGAFGSGSGSYVTSIKVGSVYGQLPVPSWEGHVFEGWYTSTSGGTAVNSEATAMGEDDVTLYAHWHESKLTIQYWNDGAQEWRSYHSNILSPVGPNAPVETETVLYNGNYVHSEYGILDVDRFRKVGYRTGYRWKIGSKESGQAVSDVNWPDFGSGEEAKGFYVAEKLGVLDQLKSSDVAVDLYPVFVANTNTAAYDGNGGSGAMPSIRCTYDQVITLSANAFHYEGYRFAGWNTKQDGTGMPYADCAEVKNLTVTNGTTVTLYAQWKPTSQSESNAADTDSAYVGLVD